MDLAKFEIDRAFSPYRKEALYCLMIDVIITLICSTVCFLIEIQQSAPALFLIFPAYFIAEIIVNYRLALLSILEVRNQSYVCKEVTVTQIKIEDSASGRWGSIVPKLYSKSLGVNRYKILCVDANNEKIKLRCAMSRKIVRLLGDSMDASGGLRRTVIFGRYSHIVLKYCDNDDLALVMNRKL